MAEKLILAHGMIFGWYNRPDYMDGKECVNISAGSNVSYIQAHRPSVDAVLNSASDSALPLTLVCE